MSLLNRVCFLQKACLQPVILLSLLVVVVILPQLVKSQGLLSYDIDWSDVALFPSNSTDITANCVCNVRQGVCDLGCCCDTDCPQAIVDYYKKLKSCLPEGPPSKTLKYCVNTDHVSRVNLPGNGDFYTQKVKQADIKFFSNLLCIVEDNNPKLGKYFENPLTGNLSPYVNLAQCPTAPSYPTSATPYNFRSYLYTSDDSYLSVPYPTLSDICDDAFPVGLGVSLPESAQTPYSTCRRSLSDVATSCASRGRLSADFYSALALQNGGAGTVSPAILRGQYLDPSSFVLTDLGNGTAAVATYDTQADLCRNALRMLNLTFFYDGEVDGSGSTILAIEMSYVVTDVHNASSAVPMEQFVAVNWVYSATSNVSETPAASLRQNSGNPGYLTGLTVLAGFLVTANTSAGNKTAVSQLTGGLQIGGAATGGLCSAAAARPVLFGYNVSSSCAIELTEDELQNHCTNGLPQKFIQETFQNFGQDVYLGIWGNSSYNNYNQWIKASISPSPTVFASSVYTPSTRSCSGIVTGVDIVILTGVSNAENNPQNKIIYASICYQVGKWTGNRNLLSTATQRFYIDYNVTFVKIPQTAVGLEKALPPLIKPLSVEILYPFTTNSAATYVFSVPSMIIGILLSVSMIILF